MLKPIKINDKIIQLLNETKQDEKFEHLHCKECGLNEHYYLGGFIFCSRCNSSEPIICSPQICGSS